MNSAALQGAAVTQKRRHLGFNVNQRRDDDHQSHELHENQGRKLQEIKILK